MNRKQIAIVGGGLSGLYAAFLLELHGITDYVLLEARSTFGGRIMNFTSVTNNKWDHFDLGPTWFWPNFQPQLNALIENLGLEKLAQYEQGNMVVEHSSNKPPTIMRGFTSSPAPMRLKGGMGTLIRALHARLNNQELYVNSDVQSIRNDNENIEISYRNNKHGSMHTLCVDHVFLALPPRLAINRIQFIPTLPNTLTNQWQQTATWMAPHAKYIAVFDKPFWRAQGLSGDARSAQGPMIEIHDASMPDGKAALFGFLGVSVNYRKSITNKELKTYCRAQMKRLFGSDAENPEADILKDWAQDTLTATEFDLDIATEHNHPPDKVATTGVWQHCLTGISSEWSIQFPGYIAGAIEAASDGVRDYLDRFNIQ